MSSRYVCLACRRVVQQRPSTLAKSQTVTDCFALNQSHKPFSTIHKHGAPTSTASKPLPHQTKTANTATTTRTSPHLNAPQNPTPKVPLKKPSTTKSIAKSIRETMPAATETYIAYGACEKLVQECTRQAEYRIPQATQKGVETPRTKEGTELGVGEGWWYQTLHLPPTFETWAQVTFLHMYLLTVRFRCFPASHARPWHQHLIDHFSYLAEDKMAVDHQMVARSERNKYLKDLFVQWRGCQAGYDEGLVKGDAVLATAVWRNIFRGEKDDVDWRRVGEVVSYIRHVLGVLGDMSDADIVGGSLTFGGNPGSERDVVSVRARGMDAKGEVGGGAANNAGATTTSNVNQKAPAKGKLMPEGGK